MDEAASYKKVKLELIEKKKKECESHKCYRCRWLSHFYYKSNYDAVFVCMIPMCIK